MIAQRRTHFRLFGALVLLVPIEAAPADAIHIPGDPPTIPAAVAAHAGGDEIIVPAGLDSDAFELLDQAVHQRSSETKRARSTPEVAASPLSNRTPQDRPRPRTRKARAPTTTKADRPTLSQRQARTIAAAIMQKDVKLWHEINGPDWTMRRLYGDDFPFPLPASPNTTLLDYTVDSVRAWRNISTSAVITTRKWYIDRVYNRLKRDVPDMRIIPGLKLREYLPKDIDYDFLADRAVWDAFAVDALRCAKITGVRQIVIMAEGPMARFYSGKYAPHVGKFREAMAPLRESGLRIIWYPFAPHARRQPISHGVRLVRSIIEAVPNSWFPSVGDGFPDREHDPDQNARRKAHIEATGGRMVHHLFVGPGKGLYVWSNGKSKQAYTLVDLVRWLHDRALGDVWVFPGTFHSKAVGVELQNLLIPGKFKIASDARNP